MLPQVVFDGVDLGAGVEEAQRRGWLRRGYRGLFPRMVDELAGRYDVVSMHHYLEHTLDPFSELDAAAKVLGPGGHLLIELPNPESLFGRLLGRLWMPWLPPQHLHMIPIGNLERALTARGMVIVAEEVGQAHQKNDLYFAVLVALHTFGPRTAMGAGAAAAAGLAAPGHRIAARGPACAPGLSAGPAAEPVRPGARQRLPGPGQKGGGMIVEMVTAAPEVRLTAHTFEKAYEAAPAGAWRAPGRPGRLRRIRRRRGPRG